MDDRSPEKQAPAPSEDEAGAKPAPPFEAPGRDDVEKLLRSAVKLGATETLLWLEQWTRERDK